MTPPPCLSNAITYNSSSCACAPGYLLNISANRCSLFTSNSSITPDGGVESSDRFFLGTLFSFDTIRRLSQSEAVFLEVTLAALLSWLLICFILRFMSLGDGKNIWFKIRWWISRFDVIFSTRHWQDDQKVVVKRKTELGGTFSVASWILFSGLLAALLYQIISKRTIEMHNVRATNAPDLDNLINDMEFNITIVSSMSCSNVRDLGSLLIGNTGFLDQVTHLSYFLNHTCFNTSEGPMVMFNCENCKFNGDHMYISWKFVDLPRNPAVAVGFRFNVTARNHGDERHLSFVSGTVKKGSSDSDEIPVTFRGKKPNILKFNLFPRLYRNLHDLKLIQPLFHEFIPGSSFSQTDQLLASLESSAAGSINMTLSINYLSAYIIEIQNQATMGPVSFLADLGGLYCISIAIFSYFLAQCEFRIKKLQDEDCIMQSIRNRQKAKEHWDKLRKYVMYTWGFNTLDDEHHRATCGSVCCSPRPVRGGGSSQQWVLKRNIGSSTEKSLKDGEMLASKRDQNSLSVALSCTAEASIPTPSQIATKDANSIPLPPSLGLKSGSEVEMICDIQKNLQQLYEYNVKLRESLIATQMSVLAVTGKCPNTLLPQAD